MKPFLRQQLDRYPIRLQELDFFLQQPEVASDMERFRALSREHAEVSEVAALYERYRRGEADLAQAREMLANLRPLEEATVERISKWLGKLSHPIRVGEHAQCAHLVGNAPVRNINAVNFHECRHRT